MATSYVTQAETFDKIVRARRSVRVYDQDALFDHEAVTRSLERAILAPNSSNLQTWEFIRITKKEDLAKAAELCLGQNTAKTARELVAVVVRTDLWKKRRDWIMSDYRDSNSDAPERRVKVMETYYNKLIPMVYTTDPLRILSTVKRFGMFVAGLARPMYRMASHSDVRIIGHKSAALAAGTFMLSMTAEGYSTCPMEGFDASRMKQFLGLTGRTEICMMISCGPAAEHGIYGARKRVAFSEVVRFK
ncbi:MAG: nitroreductase [Limisphaerales bacterium]|jgi:nitroreductase